MLCGWPLVSRPSLVAPVPLPDRPLPFWASWVSFQGLLAAVEACLLVGFGYAFGFTLVSRALPWLQACSLSPTWPALTTKRTVLPAVAAPLAPGPKPAPAQERHAAAGAGPSGGRIAPFWALLPLHTPAVHTQRLWPVLPAAAAGVAGHDGLWLLRGFFPPQGGCQQHACPAALLAATWLGASGRNGRALAAAQLPVAVRLLPPCSAAGLGRRPRGLHAVCACLGDPDRHRLWLPVQVRSRWDAVQRGPGLLTAPARRACPTPDRPACQPVQAAVLSAPALAPAAPLHAPPCLQRQLQRRGGGRLQRHALEPAVQGSAGPGGSR